MEIKKCPFCGKTVLAISKTCKHCRLSFENNIQKEDVPQEVLSEEGVLPAESVVVEKVKLQEILLDTITSEELLFEETTTQKAFPEEAIAPAKPLADEKVESQEILLEENMSSAKPPFIKQPKTIAQQDTCVKQKRKIEITKNVKWLILGGCAIFFLVFVVFFLIKADLFSGKKTDDKATKTIKTSSLKEENIPIIDGKMTIDIAAKIIESHPFLAQKSVSVTNSALSGCEADFLGSKENAYVNMNRNRSTAYYYISNGIKVGKIENLILQDDNYASCDVILEPTEITKAERTLQKQYSYHTLAPKEEGEAFYIEFEKQNSKGWSIINFYCKKNRSFKINGWKDGTFIYNITPMAIEGTSQLQ